MAGHKHAKIMAEYAKIAETEEEPWKKQNGGLYPLVLRDGDPHVIFSPGAMTLSIA